MEETEAPTIRRIFATALTGMGGKAIANALNGDGLRTRAGKLFSATAVNNILRNESYTGTSIWRNKAKGLGNGQTGAVPAEVVRIPDCHPALVSKDEFDLVQQLLTQRRPTNQHPRTFSSRFLLSGITYCGDCGATMIWLHASKSYEHNNEISRKREATSSGKLTRNQRKP